jgi:methionine-rich copper-binding protein CopC
VPSNALSNRTAPPSARAAVVPRPLGARVTAALAVLLSFAATLLGAAVLTVTSAVPAGAHDQLEASEPPADAELTAPPVEVVLSYSADLVATGTQVVVTTPDGDVDAEVTVDGPEVRAALPPDLPGGAYEVAWRVVSSDGHPIEGTFGFTVAQQPEPVPTATDAGEPAQEPTETATQADEPSPAATVPGDAAAGTGMPWLFALALVAIVAVAAAAIWRTRRNVLQGYGGPPGQH